MKNRVEAHILNWNDARYRSTQHDDITQDGAWDHARGEQKSSNEIWNGTTWRHPVRESVR